MSPTCSSCEWPLAQTILIWRRKFVLDCELPERYRRPEIEEFLFVVRAQSPRERELSSLEAGRLIHGA